MSSTLDRTFCLVTVVLFLFSTVSCTSTRVVSVEEAIEGRDATRSGSLGQRIKGYSTTEGEYVPFDGYVSRVGADSLSFRPWYTTGERAGYRKALHEVHEVEIVYYSASKGLGVLAIVVFVVAILAGVALATKESCPFLYSHDGEKYVFDGEPYGGAVMSSLQRTDYSELEHLRERNGEYRLLIRNEVDETQHTDSIHLITVDHSPETSAVMDREGNAHCFRRTSPLLAARDEHGRDLTSQLRDSDDVSWYPDLAAYASQDSLADPRNHVTLEFERPPGVDQVYLVSNVGTGQWGSHMIRVMLGMRGNRVHDFYDAINGSEQHRQALEAWSRREELFVLGVESREGDRWVRRSELHGGGPFITEKRATPLDLRGVSGDTVRLRLHPPIGFWRLESFHLAWDDDPPVVTRVGIASAVDEDGTDVLPLLDETDGTTFDQPTNDEWAELVFRAPPPPAGKRSIFAVTTGWYELHLYNDGPPDSLGLHRLTEEPGYAVRRAMREFTDFRRSGVLAYCK